MIILSIALSSHRLHLIEDVLESIFAGTQLPDKIIINISEEPFFIDKGIKWDDLPEYLYLVNQFRIGNILIIKKVPNIGPMRIAIPILEEYWDKPETIFIFWDDDLIIGKHTIEELLYWREELDCAVGTAGFTIGGNKYQIKERIWGHNIHEMPDKGPKKVHILFNGWGTTFKLKHIHKEILNWHKYKDMGIEYTNEAFIMACLAMIGTDRYVIPTSEMVRTMPTENPIHDNPVTMEANNNIIEKWFDVLVK